MNQDKKGASRRRALVVIPTFNEAENIGVVVERVLVVAAALAGWAVDVLVVDDNSPDGTADLVERMRGKAGEAKGHLHLLRRGAKEGLGRAYVAGFQWGRARGYDAFVEMDADLSHDPRELPALLGWLESRDFVVGSRYVAGGRIVGWGPARRLLSAGGSLYARALLGSPIRDMTGGFNAWRAEALKAVGLESLVASGYVFQIELKTRALAAGLLAAEIPITFRDRVRGASKMDSRIALEAIRGVLSLRRELKRRLPSFLPEALRRFMESTIARFAVVGALGTVTNAVIFYALVDRGRLLPTIGALCGFAVAVSQNYLLNQRWTFGGTGWVSQLSWGRYLKFIASSSGALAVNLAVLHALVHLPLFRMQVIPQLIGIVSGAVLNYIASRYLVFLRRII